MKLNKIAARKQRSRIFYGGLLIIVCALALMIVPRKEERSFLYGNSSKEKIAGKELEDWKLKLVNQRNPIGDDVSVELKILSNGQKVDERIYPELQEMFDAMREDGIYPVVASGYRTEEEQKAIYKDRYEVYKAEGFSDRRAKKYTEQWVAIPGTSEHQLGLAVDINADGIRSSGSEVYHWLEENAYRYGFIYRYPDKKENITGVKNEPWHYRYVGVDAALEMYQKGLCLEEYLGE